jgi:hypothetical protein
VNNFLYYLGIITLIAIAIQVLGIPTILCISAIYLFVSACLVFRGLLPGTLIICGLVALIAILGLFGFWMAVAVFCISLKYFGYYEKL